MTDADEASYATRRRVLQRLGISALALGARYSCGEGRIVREGSGERK